MFASPESITVSSAKQALQTGLAAIAGGELQFDFASLQHVDSAAVATLLAWQRAAHKAGRHLQFVNLPETLKSLVQMYGVAELLMPASAT